MFYHPAPGEPAVRLAERLSNVLHLDNPTMGAEDFSYYGKCVPSCFFFMGLRPAGVTEYPSLHQPEFDFNDDALSIGIDLFCRIALADA